MLPILYSFRRCPYAIRARMAINYAGVPVVLREVFLADKPPSMLAASSKGTVPVLVLPDGNVIDESVDIMHWALRQHDPDSWWRDDSDVEAQALVEENDFGFKLHLDHYKYADRFPEHPQQHYRAEAEKFLLKLEQRLQHQEFLTGDEYTFPDVAIFPFVRQFAFVDKPWFDQSAYPGLQRWLKSFLEAQIFLAVMTKLPAWKEGDVPVDFP